MYLRSAGEVPREGTGRVFVKNGVNSWMMGLHDGVRWVDPENDCRPLFDIIQWVDPYEIGRPSELELLTGAIMKWHRDRNLIDGSDDKTQFAKLISEAGELASSIAKGTSVIDDIGDMMVVLINIATRNGVSLYTCLDTAWQDIKDRKGKMINGTFVKESDLALDKFDGTNI